ncbi:four helix bundle protein [uncultured Planktosalinus sp.]|uniref:four helix bundle protein n=1 Tax=uncultured Planktosalinus sp. TaxID=1810935 RepID=UPI0030DBACF2
MASKHNFRKLTIWKEGIEIAKETYKTSKKFPKSEVYGLSSQLQRSAVSIPSNIAEGTARNTNKHFILYLENALGSAYEWETQLIISFEAGYINFETYKHLETKINKIQAMISKFIDGLV